MPSCIRVPPEDGGGQQRQAARGSPASTAATIRSGGGAPDRPAEEAELAHDDGDLRVRGCVPAPVTTASSTPDRSRAPSRARSAYAGSMPEVSTGVSQDGERAVVEDELDQVAGAEPPGHAPAPRRARPGPRRRPRPSGRRRPVLGAGHLGPGAASKNRSGGPGSVSGAEGRRARRRRAGPGWRPGPTRRPRRGCAPCPPGRRPRRAAPAGRRPSRSANAPSTSAITRVAVRDPLGVGREARRRRVESEARRTAGATAPRCRPRSAPRRRRSGTARTGAIDGWWLPCGPADLAGHRPPGALEGVHADDRREQRGADHLARGRCAPARAARPARRRRRTCRPAGPRSARRPAAGRPARSR